MSKEQGLVLVHVAPRAARQVEFRQPWMMTMNGVVQSHPRHAMTGLILGWFPSALLL
jgi:hypothetical protein